MFSSNDLISFVFANEGDTYYRDDLQKLELEQHLWYLLHENFDAVYFLHEENKQLAVNSFGDHQGPCPNIKKSIFVNGEKQMQGWIQKQLQRKPGRKGTAFVCRLQDFCNVLSQPQWEKTLRDIKRGQHRSGIFVLIASATAEKTTGLLLDSTVFEYLQETAVTNLRSGELREMYDILSKQKWGSCFFFNEFTPENLRALLLHVVMEQPSRMESAEQLDKLGNTLYNLLNAPGKFSLFECPFPGKYLTFYDLYKQLQKNEVWECLVKHCREGVCSCTKERGPSILREKNSCAGRCMQMKLPQKLQENEECEALLREIQALVSVPKNRKENPRILEWENDFQNCIDTVSADDRQTYITVLRALKFCAEQVYMPPAAEKLVLEIAEDYKSVIQASKECYRMNKTLETNRPDDGNSLNQEIQKIKQEQIRKNLHIYDTVVKGLNAAIVEATQSLHSPSVTETKDILEKYRDTRERYYKNAETELDSSELEDLKKWIKPKSDKNNETSKKKKDAESGVMPDPDVSAFEGMTNDEKRKMHNKIKPPMGL